MTYIAFRHLGDGWQEVDTNDSLKTISSFAMVASHLGRDEIYLVAKSEGLGEQEDLVLYLNGEAWFRKEVEESS